MQFLIEELESHFVDGELFLFPTDEQFSKLANGWSIDSKEVVNKESLQQWVKYTSDLKSVVKLGLHSGRPLRGGWWPCYVLTHNDAYQRVHIESLTCGHCGWSGRSANSVVGNLYDGSPEADIARKKGFSLSSVTCPKCNRELPRPSIWVE